MRSFELLKALLACVIVEMEAAGRGAGCAQVVLPGAAFTPMILESDEGQIWVRLVSAYPAIAPGQPVTGPESCVSLLGATIEVGAARCIEVPEPRVGFQPGPVEAAAESQLTDMEIIRKALMCCGALGDEWDWILGTYTPMGPQGVLIGGYWTISVVPESEYAYPVPEPDPEP